MTYIKIILAVSFLSIYLYFFQNPIISDSFLIFPFLIGKALCMLNEDMFKKRVPNSGDILYQALQNLIPKVAYNSTTINYQLDCKYYFKCCLIKHSISKSLSSNN